MINLTAANTRMKNTTTEQYIIMDTQNKSNLQEKNSINSIM